MVQIKELFSSKKMVCSEKKQKTEKKTESGQQASKCMFLINVVSSFIKHVVSRTLQRGYSFSFCVPFLSACKGMRDWDPTLSALIHQLIHSFGMDTLVE